jgi:uncharacterized alpha-E superfamily protein
MSDLREKIADAIGGAVSQDDRYLEHADAVLRVLAEHGDTQQVREQIKAALVDNFTTSGAFNAITAVVTPILAARNDLRDERWSVVATRNAAIQRAERAKADLAAVRQQLDQVRAELADCEDAYQTALATIERGIP